MNFLPANVHPEATASPGASTHREHISHIVLCGAQVKCVMTTIDDKDRKADRKFDVADFNCRFHAGQAYS